ncbi:MAG: AAA family ATPase [Lachnospiraceae bacterium]|nr:AAA family ATPase [Lachnospiraceae bacterium]
MKKIGIGYEEYKRFIDENMYYIDKTLLIQDVVEKGGKVTLFTRPRRFGKTLALSMLRTFFEREYDSNGDIIDKRRYFEGKKIMDAPEEILSMMGRYPVINLSLKSAKQPRFRAAALQLRDEIVSEFNRHMYIIDSDKLTAAEADQFRKLCAPKGWDELDDETDFRKEIDRYATALKTLSVCLKKHHGENVIVLIDEYDVPLENAYYEGFYNEMVGFIRSLFESVLKTNDALQFGVVTGCLRISKESIFTGLNHLEISSVYNNSFEEGFGFTQAETEQMLKDYGIEDRIPEAKEWYDGYLFGTTEIYNPWSVIKYVKSIAVNHMKFPMPYWANTSSNTIIKDLVWQADENMKRQLDVLISGGTIEKEIHEDITYDDIHASEDNLWNFLFFTGYMRKESERTDGERIFLTMRIPNIEIRSIYRGQISEWFKKKIKETNKGELNKAVLEGDTDGIAGYISDLLAKSISVFDSDESFYHGFFLSLLYEVPNYAPRSNREEGDGRPDIVLYPDRPRDPAIIFEIKVRKKFSEMEDGLQEAWDQIKDRKYEEGVLDDGYLGVKSYGICFCKKSCIVGALPG